MHHPQATILDWDALPSLFPGFAEPTRWLPLLQQHAALLQDASPAVRATAIDAGETPSRLYAESLETLRIALSHVDRPVERFVDVGSGGGFPGLVAAALFPGWDTVLIESHGRKAALLREIAAQLGLTRVTVQHTRAEDAGRGELRDSACLVTAKAVAELRVALEYTAPIARVGGIIALPKGSRLPEEEAEAQSAMSALAVEYVRREPMRSEISATPWTAIFRKVAATPAALPRRAGMPSKHPL